MKRIARRFWAFLLVVCCIASLCPEALITSASGSYIFEDHFSDAALNGWQNASVGQVSDGVYSITGDGTNLVAAPISETLYAVQSKAIFTKMAGAANSTASLLIGADANATEYYEFGIGVAGNTTYAFLYKQCADDEQSTTIYQLTKSIPGTENGRILQNTEYVLSAIVENGKLLCYINGEKFTEYANAGITGQYAGVRSVGANAKFDDFIIKKEETKKVAAIKVVNPPSEVTVNGVGLSFDIQVTYSGLYGVETISSDAEGVSIAGFDGKTGNHKFTVSYGGASTTFTANVVKDTAPVVYFSDTFNEGVDTSKWRVSALNAKKGYSFEYTIKGTSEQAVATFPKNIGDYTNVITTGATLIDSSLESMDTANYVVEMDATIVSNTTVENGRAADAALDVAATGGLVYSFRVRADGTAILYQHTTIMAQSTIQGFKLGQKFHMKVEVYDGMLLCYYNDQCVLIYQDETVNVENRESTIGFRAVNGTIKFDNFKVTEIPEKSVWAATSITIDDLQNKESNISTIKAYVIEPTRYLVKLHYADGSFVPVAFKQSMLSGYSSESKKDQTVTLTYGPLSKTLYYDYTSYIFYESFESGQSDYWRDMTNTSQGYITTAFKNGLQITCAKDSVTHELSRYVDMFAEYPDVKVTADIKINHTDNTRVRRIGVRARYDRETGYFYEYTLSYDATKGEMYAILYRRSADGLTELNRYGASTLAELLGEENIYFGKQYTLTLECAGNQIYLYLNGKLVDAYFDTSEYAVLSGSGAGYRSLNTSGIIANFRVETATARSIKSMALSNVDGTLELYQGFEVSPYDYSVNVSFNDGLVANLSLDASMIGEFDNITPGVKKVPIHCLGTVLNVSVKIVERPDYIKEFTEKVKDCKTAKKITLEEEKYIEELQDMYNSLSGYEVSLIDEKVCEKYQEVVDALYRLQHSELAEYDTVYLNDFNGTIEETEWFSYAENSMGTWRTFNSTLVNEQEKYGWNDATSYLENDAFYGEINSVEADVMLTKEDGCYVSIVSCSGELGYYHARVRYNPVAAEGEKFVVELYKYTGSHRKLGQASASIKGIEMELGEWYNLRLTTIEGKLLVYLDDVKMIEYDDSEATDCMTTGTFGFRALYGDMRYDSLRVMGTKLEVEEYVPQIEPTYYKDDFEDEVQGSNPSHWIEETDSDNWKVYKKAERLVYGTKSKDYTYTWLHTFESDPEITMDFMVENASKDGRIEFLTRYTQEKYSYAGIGYDFAKSKWYVYTNRGMDFEPQIVYAEETYTLKSGSWNTIKIQENDISIKVYVNDKLVIEDTNAFMTGYGRIGILSENANIYVDNLSYKMPHGGSVSDGVIEYLFDYDTFGEMSHMEIESLGGEYLIGVSATTQYISHDQGMSWEKDISGEYTEVRGKGLGYPSILEISEGVYLMVYADNYTVYKSTDYMKTWTKVGQIITDIDGQEGIIHLNSLTKLTLKDGTERIFLPIGVRRKTESGEVNGHYTRIFYSDDQGVTWKESANDTRAITPNYVDDPSSYFTWTESKMTIDKDGVIRLYNSRQYECIVYTESHDGGVTWEGFYSIPYLQNGQTSHSIAEDPNNLGTYYMVCLNTKSRSLNSTLPRNRLSLVKSTDGKNWEYVMDIERFTDYGNYQSSNLYQIIDPSISIIDGYMYVTLGRSYACSVGSPHNKQAVLCVRLEMDKLPETTEWSDANLADSTRPETLEIETMPQTIFGEGDIFSVYGGTLKLTAFNGNVSYQDLNTLSMISDEPNMYKKGTYNVSMMNWYGQIVSFDMEVTDNYNITWNVQGKGEVTPYFIKIAKGLERTFTAVPEDGWKVKEILVNGEVMKLTDNQFSIVGSEDVTIDVVFEEKTNDVIIWVVTIGVTLVVGGMIAIYIFKKEWLIAIKNKASEVIKWKH